MDRVRLYDGRFPGLALNMPVAHTIIRLGPQQPLGMDVAIALTTKSICVRSPIAGGYGRSASTASMARIALATRAGLVPR